MSTNDRCGTGHTKRRPATRHRRTTPASGSRWPAVSSRAGRGDPAVPTTRRSADEYGERASRGPCREERVRARPRRGLRTEPGRRRPRAGPAADPRGRAGRAPRLLLRPRRRGDQGPVPRHGADPAHRHRGHRAAAARRAGHLGPAARPGGRADRLRPRAAHAGLRLPDLPRARRRLVPRHRPAAAARPVPRRRPGRLGPQRRQLRPLHDRDRRADPARHRLRDGHAARRRRRHRRPGPRRRRGRLLRRRREQPGRRQRGVHLRRLLQRPGRVLLPEQPVGDLRADRAAVAGSRSTSAPSASASPASGWTATTCSRRTP